jgi:hypothetical protein
VAVALGTNGLDGGSFPGIQDPELKGRLVGKSAHGSSHRINFPDNMAFSNSPNGGIARHLTDEIKVEGQKKGA